MAEEHNARLRLYRHCICSFRWHVVQFQNITVFCCYIVNIDFVVFASHCLYLSTYFSFILIWNFPISSISSNLYLVSPMDQLWLHIVQNTHWLFVSKWLEFLLSFLSRMHEHQRWILISNWLDKWTITKTNRIQFIPSHLGATKWPCL